jgi:hypothetical protein
MKVLNTTNNICGAIELADGRFRGYFHLIPNSESEGDEILHICEEADAERNSAVRRAMNALNSQHPAGGA